MKINDEERKKRGQRAESAVCNLLRKHGYRIIDRNVTFASIGEIDIVALRHNYIVIVEVKARQSNTMYGSPLATITPKKISKVIRSTYCYLKKNRLMNNYVMILAAGVSLNKSGEIETIEIVPVERL